MNKKYNGYYQGYLINGNFLTKKEYKNNQANTN